MKSAHEQPKQGKLIVIVGPTASGKSALAMDLAQQYGGEIICADSRTIYRGFDIGTAKPSADDRALVPHHMLDICEPGEAFSAAQFKQLADTTIREVWGRGKPAFLVGGSGMYVDAVLFGYSFRGKYPEVSFGMGDLARRSLEELQELVAEQYPIEYAGLDSKNRLRLEQILIRGLAHQSDRGSLKYDCLILGMEPNKPSIRQNIAIRCQDMLSKGFVQEVMGLIDAHGMDCPQLNIIGYKHARDFIRGTITQQEMVDRFVRDDCALAKRQMTWFRRNPAVHWLAQPGDAAPLVEEYSTRI